MSSYPYGDLANSGRCAGPALGAEPRVRWRFEAGGTVSSAPVVAGGAAFFMDDDGTLYALNADTGDLTWTWASEDPCWSTAWVGVCGDLVLIERQENEVVHAVGRADGKPRWSLEDVWYPLVVDDLLLVVDTEQVRAVDLATRAERWSAPVSFGLLGARPAVADGLVVVTGGFEGNHSHGGVAAIDLDSGEVRWFREQERDAADETLTVHPAHAAVVGGRVWLNRDRWLDRMRSEVAALDLATGADSWVYVPDLKADEYLHGSVVVGDGLLYCHTETRVLAVDPVAAATRFAVDLDATVTATPLLAGGLLHVATDDGRLHGIDAGSVAWTTTVDEGEVDWPEYEGDEFSQRETPFTLVEGVAYVRNGNSVSAISSRESVTGS